MELLIRDKGIARYLYSDASRKLGCLGICEDGGDVRWLCGRLRADYGRLTLSKRNLSCAL